MKGIGNKWNCWICGRFLNVAKDDRGVGLCFNPNHEQVGVQELMDY